MKLDKVHPRHLYAFFIFYFNRKIKKKRKRKRLPWNTKRIICEIYGENVVTADVCEKRFKRFRNGEMDVNDKVRSGKPKEFENDELQELLDKDLSSIIGRACRVKLGVNASSVSR